MITAIPVRADPPEIMAYSHDGLRARLRSSKDGGATWTRVERSVAHDGATLMITRCEQRGEEIVGLAQHRGKALLFRHTGAGWTRYGPELALPDGCRCDSLDRTLTGALVIRAHGRGKSRRGWSWSGEGRGWDRMTAKLLDPRQWNAPKAIAALRTSAVAFARKRPTGKTINDADIWYSGARSVVHVYQNGSITPPGTRPECYLGTTSDGLTRWQPVTSTLDGTELAYPAYPAGVWDIGGEAKVLLIAHRLSSNHLRLLPLRGLRSVKRWQKMDLPDATTYRFFLRGGRRWSAHRPIRKP